GSCLGRTQNVSGVRDHSAQDGTEVGRGGAGSRGPGGISDSEGGCHREHPGAAADTCRWGKRINQDEFLSRSIVNEIISRACVMTCSLASSERLASRSE